MWWRVVNIIPVVVGVTVAQIHDSGGVPLPSVPHTNVQHNPNINVAQHSSFPGHSNPAQHSNFPGLGNPAQHSNFPGHSNPAQHSNFPGHSNPAQSSFPGHSNPAQHSNFPGHSNPAQQSNFPGLSNPAQHSNIAQHSGVPLPSHAGSGNALNIPQQPSRAIINHGVPLPPPTGTHTKPSAVIPQVLYGTKLIHNPGTDISVQKLLLHPALHSSLQSMTKADKAVRVQRVITASENLSSGQLYYLTLSVGETNCPVGVPDVEKCQLDPTDDQYVCEVTVWVRAWLDSTKVIYDKSKCEEVEDDNDFHRWGPRTSLRSPSSTEVQVVTLPPGVEANQLAVEAFNYVDRGSESKFNGRMVNFDVSDIKHDSVSGATEARVDVEYGFTYCLRSNTKRPVDLPCVDDPHRPHYLCSVRVVHDANTLTPLEVVPILDDDGEIHCKKKISAGEELVVPVPRCAGCPELVSVNDPDVKAVAEFAAAEYDRQNTDDDDLHKILRILKAERQVLSGVKYMLRVELAETTCKKVTHSVDVNRALCPLHPGEETKLCDLLVWNNILVHASCDDSDNKPSLQDEFIVPVSALGAPGIRSLLPIGTVEEVSLSAAAFMAQEYNRREDDEEYYKIVQVLEATPQVSEGGEKVHHIVVELGETRCRKVDPNAGENCPLQPNEETEVCEGDVAQLSPQANAFRVVSMKCDDIDDYLKKKLTPVLQVVDVMPQPFLDSAADTHAGFVSIATDDPSVSHAALLVADQYNLLEDGDDLYVMSRVLSSTEQAVDGGKIYHLELEMVETQCKKYQVVGNTNLCQRSDDIEVCEAEVLMQGSGEMHLNKLYCDDMNDYYTKKLQRGRSAQPHGLVGTGQWQDVSVDDRALRRLGRRIADEYDSRSDEDSLFIFHKVLKARKQIVAGVQYQLVVELQETVCPKYKRRINKSRCAPDIGEDHVVCEAHVYSRPWLDRDDITHFKCAEKDEFFSGHDSAEVTLPKVHPSAHARPVFRSHFLVRTSGESDESNERFYQPHSTANTHHRIDTDEDDDSDEWMRARARVRVRGRRAIHYTHTGLPESLVGELATFAIQAINANTSADITYKSAVKEVLRAEMEEHTGRITLELLVVPTTCHKNTQSLAPCSEDTKKPALHCSILLVREAELDGHIIESLQCRPRDTKQK